VKGKTTEEKKQFQWKQSFVDCRLAIPKTKQDVGSNVTPHFGSHVPEELLFSKQSGTPHTSHQLYRTWITLPDSNLMLQAWVPSAAAAAATD
jgi:hypothetical protein